MSYDQRKPGKECSICHHTWNPHTKRKTPLRCPHCTSRLWNKPNEISVEPIGVKPKRKKRIRPYRKNTYRAKLIRKQLIERDGLWCTHCWTKTPSSKLHAHHLDYNPDNNTLDNLKILCIPCHMTKYHRGGAWDTSKKD